MSICTQQEPSNMEPAEDVDRLNQLATGVDIGPSTSRQDGVKMLADQNGNWHLAIKMEAGTDLAKAHLSRIAKSLSNCNATTGDIITTTERLKQELEVTTDRQEIASCFFEIINFQTKR
ncbi:hypothetical protein Tco_1361955 [Tanacetum coccineum]